MYLSHAIMFLRMIEKLSVWKWDIDVSAIQVVPDPFIELIFKFLPEIVLVVSSLPLSEEFPRDLFPVLSRRLHLPGPEPVNVHKPVQFINLLCSELVSCEIAEVLDDGNQISLHVLEPHEFEIGMSAPFPATLKKEKMQ